jgi:HAE1 family hydrophobic/amphiphilic exporter-1
MNDEIKSGQNGLTALFIRRPVLAFVLNVLIAVAGVAAFYGVEVRELPDVDRAVISVNTNFTGAAAETVDREMTDVIESPRLRREVHLVALVLWVEPRHHRVQ